MNIDFYWYKEKLYVIEVILIRWWKKKVVEDGRMVLGCKIIYLNIFEGYIFVIFVF